VSLAQHHSWIGVAALGLVAACTPAPEEVLVDPSNVPFEFAFLVEVHDQAIQRLSAPFGPAPDGFGQPTLQGLNPKHSLYMVSIDLATLREAVPGYDSTRADQLAVTSLSTSRLDAHSDPARIVLPAQSLLHRVNIEAATLEAASLQDLPELSTLALVVPTDLQFCERTVEPVRAFGARSHLLHPPSFEWPTSEQDGFHRIRDLMPLGPDRVLGVTSELLFDVRVGEQVQPPSTDSLARTHHIGSLGIASVGYDALALDPRTNELWVSGPAGQERGFLARYEVADQGLRLLQTYTQDDAGAFLPLLRDVHVDSEGRVLAGGNQRVVLLRGSNSDVFTRVLLPMIDKVDESDDYIQFIKHTGDPAEPHLIGLKGDAVFLGDVSTGQFRLEYVQPVANRPLGVSPFLEEAVIISTTERWAAGRGAIFSRWSPTGGWLDQTLIETMNADGCTLGASINGSAVHYLSIAVDDRHIFLAGDRCNAVLAQDRNLGCTAVLTLPNEDLARVNEEAVRVLRLAYGRLWVGGERGRLYTIDRP